MKRNLFFLVLICYSYTIKAQNQISVKCGLVFPDQHYKFATDLFTITQYPKLTPVISYGFACIIDSSKSVSLVLEGEYRSGHANGLEYVMNTGLNSTSSDLKYDVACLSLVGRFNLARNRKWFAVAGVSYNSCFREVTRKQVYAAIPIGNADILDARETTNGKTGFVGGVGYNYNKFTAQARINFIKYREYADYTTSYSIDHSYLSLDLYYALNGRKPKTILSAKDSMHSKGANTLLYGLRLGGLSTMIDSSKYNTDKMRIDSCKRFAVGIELSFFVIPKLAKKVFLVAEVGVRRTQYKVFHTPISSYPSYEVGYGLNHHLWTITANVMLRVGLGRKEAFYFQSGIGVVDQYRYNAKGVVYDAPVSGSWDPQISNYYTKEINDFPLAVSRRNLLFGFGYQGIKIGNKRLFTECRVSAPLDRFYFKDNASMDNVTISLSLGIFFNKFND